MNELYVKDVIKITNGKLVIGDENLICGKFSFDTRDVKKGDTYIRICNDKFEKNEYWKDAFKIGANICIINKCDIDISFFDNYKNKCLIQVDNTLDALQKIAKYKRSLYEDLFVVAITGSVGKTSTKDMVSNVVSQKFKTLKTKGNYNNHIGVPLTVLGLEDHKAAVIEMGMNHFGEIRTLTNIAKPKISVITNIGTSHIGNLGSRENILKSKLEILEGMDKKEIVINNDNDILHNWYLENKNKDILIHTFGIDNKSDVWAENIKLNENHSSFICHLFDKSFIVNVPVGGIHFVYNALCSVLVGYLLNIDINDIKMGIESFELTKKRLEINKLKNGALVINDAYNASLESIKAAVGFLEGYKEKRKIAVIGDIFELGNFSEKLHREVGKFLYKSDIDILICNGENSKFVFEEANKYGTRLKKVIYYDSKENIIDYLKDKCDKNDIVLFKASNGMKFYDLCPKENGSFDDIKLNK